MIDELKETFIDINLTLLLNFHQTIVHEYKDHGFLNESKSYEFIHCIVDSLQLNDKKCDYSSEDE